MIALSQIVSLFRDEFLQQYGDKLSAVQRMALNAFGRCRTTGSNLMELCCSACEESIFTPHSCGHRNCPKCQNHESWEWIARETQKRVDATYFMITFTLPSQFRNLVYTNQKATLSLLYSSVWETVSEFCENDKALGGTAGATAVLHTHSRQLQYHPHVHLVIPAAVVDKKNNLWKIKKGKYLFNHKALAKVFRAKMLAAIREMGLALPERYPGKWIVDCRNVGSGAKAIEYLGRYLYRGVIAERDILSIEDGKITFRYLNSSTKTRELKTVSGVHFIWLILQHVLPKRFRRARSFGFLHANSKLITPLLRYMFRLADPSQWRTQIKSRPTFACKSCGGVMGIVRGRINLEIERALGQEVAYMNSE